MRNLTKTELRNLTINRLLLNDNESESLFNTYENEKHLLNCNSFENFLNRHYSDLEVSNIENTIIENINNNNNYLD